MADVRARPCLAQRSGAILRCSKSRWNNAFPRSAMPARLLADELGLTRLAAAVAAALRESPDARRRDALLCDTRRLHAPLRRIAESGALPFGTAAP
jgi:hypothetical protein